MTIREIFKHCSFILPNNNPKPNTKKKKDRDSTNKNNSLLKTGLDGCLPDWRVTCCILWFYICSVESASTTKTTDTCTVYLGFFCVMFTLIPERILHADVRSHLFIRRDSQEFLILWRAGEKKARRENQTKTWQI